MSKIFGVRIGKRGEVKYFYHLSVGEESMRV